MASHGTSDDSPQRSPEKVGFPTVDQIARLTSVAADVHQTTQLAGFLTEESEDAIYVADPHGTWVIPRDGITDLREWEDSAVAPVSMREVGKPVRVLIREGTTIHEIRPWRIRKGGNPTEAQARRVAIEEIFTLGAGDLPITPRTAIGEREVAKLEMLFARRLGWDPDNSTSTQHYFSRGLRGPTVKCESDGGCT